MLHPHSPSAECSGQEKRRFSFSRLLVSSCARPSRRPRHSVLLLIRLQRTGGKSHEHTKKKKNKSSAWKKKKKSEGCRGLLSVGPRQADHAGFSKKEGKATRRPRSQENSEEDPGHRKVSWRSRRIRPGHADRLPRDARAQRESARRDSPGNPKLKKHEEAHAKDRRRHK